MKRAGNLFERIVDRENLRLAVARALRGKRHRPDARRFVRHLDDNLNAMQVSLLSGDVSVGCYQQFVIHDPKERIITAPCFRERVLHHAVMNVCEPVFERWLIDDTYACRRGLGRLAALDRAAHFARRYPFFLKLDIRKYFDSVPHPVLLAKLEQRIKDRRVLRLLARIVGSFRGTLGRGLPIGSLTSQHLANFYLGWFDRQVKEQWRVRGYVRYMDDMLLWSDSKRQLRDLLHVAREYLLQELGLDLKPSPYLNRTSHGVDFLGCRLFHHRMTLNRRSRVRFRRKLRRLERQHQRGGLSERQLQQRVTALLAFTRTPGLDSWHFRRRVLQQTVVSGHEARTG